MGIIILKYFIIEYLKILCIELQGMYNLYNSFTPLYFKSNL